MVTFGRNDRSRANGIIGQRGPQYATKVNEGLNEIRGESLARRGIVRCRTFQSMSLDGKVSAPQSAGITSDAAEAGLFSSLLSNAPPSAQVQVQVAYNPVRYAG